MKKVSTNLARQLQRQEVRHTEKVQIPKQKRRRITKGEKLFYILFAMGLIFFSIQIISNQASIYQINKEIQNLETELNDQVRVVQELEAQVQDLSKYDRLTEEAKKLGLTNKRENIKVVSTKK